MELVVHRKPTALCWDDIVHGSIRNIELNGGDSADSDVILGHFGLIDHWIEPLLSRCSCGVATLNDAEFLREQLKRTSRN